MPDMKMMDKNKMMMMGMVPIEKSSEMMCDGGMSYPYGTEMCMPPEVMEKMNMGGMASGDMVEIRGYAYVSEMEDRMTDDQKKEMRMRLQMVGVKVSRYENSMDVTQRHMNDMYGE